MCCRSSTDLAIRGLNLTVPRLLSYGLALTRAATPPLPSAAALAAVALVLMGATAGEEAKLQGSLAITLRGSGAAPFGITAAIFGGTNMGYNLGRLLQTAERGGLESLGGLDFQQVLPASESYQGTMDFELRAKGRNRWELERLKVRYDFVDRTRLEYDQASIVDAMNDSGTVTFADGRWQAPGNWQPEADPKISLETFRAESRAQCEDPGVNRTLLKAKALISDTSDWVTCYDLEVFALHPMQPTGESHWKSPMGEVSVKARDGVLEFSGDSGLDFPSSLPLPPGTPDVTRKNIEAMLKMGQMTQDFLESGMGEIELNADMTWERSYRGVLQGRIKDDSTYAILSGAQARERLELSIVDLVLEKVERSWLPRGDDSGKPVAVKIKARSPESEPVPLRLTLYKVTEEKGTCLNSQDDETEFDLYVEASDNPLFKQPEKTKDGWVVETRQPQREATLEVRARDFGAWARLKAEGKFGENWYTLDIEDSDREYTTIPLDERADIENYVADAWEERMQVEAGTAADADMDVTPDSLYLGDGLSLYEEYRGFEVFGEHRRTDPERKTLLIHVQRGSGLYDYVKAASGPTDLEIHVIRAHEFGGIGDRRVNFNRGIHSTVEQHGLYVKGQRLADGVLGEAHPPGCLGRSTGCWQEIRVDRSKHRECAESSCDDACCDSLNCSGGQTINQRKLLDTVVHEMLHGLGVHHHGNSDWRKFRVCYHHILEEEDGCWTGKLYPEPCAEGDGTPLVTYVARPRGEHSGDQRCVMSYSTADVYRRPGGPWAQEPDSKFLLDFDNPVPYMDVCGSPAGTLFNDADGVGDAAKGNCAVQIHVTDAEGG